MCDAHSRQHTPGRAQSKLLYAKKGFGISSEALLITLLSRKRLDTGADGTIQEARGELSEVAEVRDAVLIVIAGVKWTGAAVILADRDFDIAGGQPVIVLIATELAH